MEVQLHAGDSSDEMQKYSAGKTSYVLIALLRVGLLDR